MNEIDKTELYKELKDMKNNKKELVMKKKKNTFVINGVILMTLVVAFAKLIIDIINNNGVNNLINDILIILVIILLSLSYLINKEKLKNLFFISTNLTIISMLAFNMLAGNNVNISKLVPSFSNTSVNDAIAWASGNNIEYEQVYEYSDNVAEFDVISQSVDPSTEIEGVKKIIFTVSSGPNYDKQVILSNMIGWNIEDAIKHIEENYLNNVELTFSINTEVEKDSVFEQSVKGQIRRNALLKLNISIGDGTFSELEAINMKNKTLFDAKLWLGKNNVKYKLEYQFSDTVKRNSIISQSIKEGTTVKETDTMTLIVSKGAEIIVPNLSSMSIEDITKWIVDNKLRVKYTDEYHEKIELGKLISANVKESDKIEEGTEISLIVSKGQLRMPAFTSLSEFRDWAAKYNINIEEVYEFNDVKKGNIIKFSHEENKTIAPTDTITVYVSNGKSVNVPSFIGKSSSSIRSTCSSLGLNCTFYYSGYSSSGKDIALSQNKKSGSTVVSGTYVSIGLSKGVAKTFTIELNESQLSIGNADQTISSLRSYFTSKYSGVTFVFSKKASNVYTNAGFVHESSPVKDGTKVTQGKTYYVWITN